MSPRDDFLEEFKWLHFAMTPLQRLRTIEDPAIPPRVRAMFLYQRGLERELKGRFEAASEDYSQAIELAPDYIEAWHSSRDDFLEAFASLYLALTPLQRLRTIEEPAIPPRVRAMFLYQRGQERALERWFEAAIADYSQAIELVPDYVEAWYCKGLALAELNRLAEAVASYDEVIRLQPEHAPAWRNRAELLYSLNACDAGLAAVPDWEPSSEDADYWVQQAIDLTQQHCDAEAIAHYDRALALQPDRYPLWHQRGLALRRLGRFEGAIANFDRALTLNPDFYPATKSRLYTLLTTGQIVSHMLGHCTLAERQRLWTDLAHMFDSLIKQKMPALIIIGITALLSTHSQMVALGIAAICLAITLWGDLIREAEK